MPKGISTRIGPNLLKALTNMGHGDLIIIADDSYPSITKTPGGVSIQAKGSAAAEMIEDILGLMPLDMGYCEHPVEYMVPDQDAGVSMDRPKVWGNAVEAMVRNGYMPKIVGEIERTKFYEKVGKAHVTVCIGEHQPHGCFILQKGILQVL